MSEVRRANDLPRSSAASPEPPPDRSTDPGADRSPEIAEELALLDPALGTIEPPVRSVLFGRACRDDDGMTGLQERFHFRIGHLAKEHGGRLHREDSCPARRAT